MSAAQGTPLRLSLGRWLEREHELAALLDRPWLVLGKGPTFSRLTDEHRHSHHLFGLNHVVREIPLTIAHAIDIDVVIACRQVLASNCRYLLMPRVPHVDSAPGDKLLEQYFGELPELLALERQDRLVWYNCSTSRPHPGSPVIDVRHFSSEAAFGILAAMGVRTIRSLGIDGGRHYSATFGDLASSTRLQNGQPMFDLQFERLRRIVTEHGIDYATLAAPIRIGIRSGDGQQLAAAVLEYSIRKCTSFPVEIAAVPPGGDLNGYAIRIDAAALATGDVAAAPHAEDDECAWLHRFVDHQPWMQPEAPRSAAWVDEFTEAVNAGAVSAAMVRSAVKRGHADARLLALPRLAPPANGDGAALAAHRARSLRRELANLRLSRTWQLGRMLMRPAQFALRLTRGRVR